VVHFGERDPSGVTLARDVGLTGFALRVERVELLLEPIVGTPNFGRSGFRMFALRDLDGGACALPQTEETGTRPMGPSDLTGDNCEGLMAPAVPFEPVNMDKHGIGDAAPFAHKPRAGLQTKSAVRAFARRLPPSRGSGVPACA